MEPEFIIYRSRGRQTPSTLEGRFAIADSCLFAFAQKDLGEKEAELFKPIQEAAMKAINEVAKAKGYEYVLDRATLIVANGTDILADVKAQMGI